MIDFTTLDYLKEGNETQRRAYEVLTRHRIFEKLKEYSPVLAGTVPIGIDVEGSDLDIICQVDLTCEEDFLDELALKKIVPPYVEVAVETMVINGERSIVLNCMLEGFPVEIFGQDIPPIRQNAYLHMLAEYRILEEKGDGFKQEIIQLKKQGIKTEPAFGLLLELENPYEDLLKF
ncbi:MULTISPECIES: DUF4269 domain-containing protein [Chryseobacterium]|uniref:DUF4269 domain-containing protein n=1 Tax=Chryseobacterium camelliae TaxID=1265445 RepID=A0ABU0TJC9_9FLAO|nr:MULTISPECIES: DUF4269 domain-containing protein [Chryseobacterium]MDT3408991.1 hypothetical protein [Pseudacidovorax intermedius]MDQ1097151.1 hypothetical protein [Chryseobacterium camelliae]MDQ1101089.1 hypothetical protein [Chryseobacterium sp. SORGH_AS_1048]MDR6084531.1 hypothetical protein [Chryseobacterium sp. SORGH_AS_0909]MDR6132801.1 hypothetical protein [Chryseobacterium sp. SORGH_AS_1175]